MTEFYVSVRDAGITVALLSNGKHESLPPYVTGSRPAEPETDTRPVRQTGGLTAEQFDRMFPVWAGAYPGRVQVVR